MPLGIGGRGDNLILDATLVGALLDAEVAVLAPVRVPAVGNLQEGGGKHQSMGVIAAAAAVSLAALEKITFQVRMCV